MSIKMLFNIVLIFILGIVIMFFILGMQSKYKTSSGLVNGRLSKCTTKPNCVCSEYKKDADHYIEPLFTPKNNLHTFKKIIVQMGGNIQTEQEDYMAAIFTSKIFAFVDDVEFRFDEKQQQTHLRSASRVGHSDMGVNRKRLELLKRLYHTTDHKI